MGLTIQLENERGEVLESIQDSTNILHQVLPSADTAAGAALYNLSRIDWYGDTVFNRLQAADIVEELQEIEEREQASRARSLLSKILDLAHRCRDGNHLYLKFYGD